MPNIKSAAKRIRTAAKRRERNKKVKTIVKNTIRRFEEAITIGNIDDAREKLKQAQIKLDKAVTKGVLHKNKAARKKSRLAKKFKSIAG